jgi:hypothetical protein
MSLSCTGKGVLSDDTITHDVIILNMLTSKEYCHKDSWYQSKLRSTNKEYASNYRLSRTTRALVTRPYLPNFFSKSRSVMA